MIKECDKMTITAHINLDDDVGVRLTKRGLRVLKMYLESQPHYYPETIKEKMNRMKVGTCHVMSFRKLISIFGHCMYSEIQNPTVFEDDEIIWTSGNAIVGVKNGDMPQMR
jgi:hypothetical protein